MSEGHLSRKKFIGLGVALGLGSVGASTITGCGGGGGPAGSGGTSTASDTTAGGSAAGSGREVGEGQTIAAESEVEPNSALSFINVGTGQQGVLVRLENGEFAAYSAVCTHQACTVAYRPEEKKITCPCHGSVFDPARGAAVENGPATLPLPEVGIEVRAGEVFLA
ncbi:MAG: Rieske (2Fe-2S) protein [Rubrobacter sp.]|nr:Rieske (2Fe-2S) protein [Rubrobacter sp.]